MLGHLLWELLRQLCLWELLLLLWRMLLLPGRMLLLPVLPVILFFILSSNKSFMLTLPTSTSERQTRGTPCAWGLRKEDGVITRVIYLARDLRHDARADRLATFP